MIIRYLDPWGYLHGPSYPKPSWYLLSELLKDPSEAPLRLMDKILHDPKDPKLWELWYIPYYG